MFSPLHRTDRRAGACNDNGRFAQTRRNGNVYPAGVVALAAHRGSVVLSYVADGVMIISRDAVA